jgi:hypothetical protein
MKLQEINGMNDRTTKRLLKSGFSLDEVCAMQRLIGVGLRKAFDNNPELPGDAQTVLGEVVRKAWHLFEPDARSADSLSVRPG